MNTSKTIIKNIGVLGFSQAINSVVNFTLLINVARYLGPIGYGKFSFAMTFTTFFLVIANLGMDNYLIRELARNKRLTDIYITNLVILKILLAFITYGLIALSINLMGYSNDMVNLVYIFGAYMILNSFILVFRSIFQSHEKMEYSGVMLIAERLMLLPLILFAVSSKYTLLEFGYIYVFVESVIVISGIYLVLTRITWPKMEINLKLCRDIIVGSIPFSFNALFGIIYFKICIFMLSIYIGDAAVGIYNAAYNPLYVLTGIISTTVMTAIYPMMARSFISSKQSLNTSTILASKFLAIIGFPITCGCIILAEEFISLFYKSGFHESVLAFQILALFVPFELLRSVNGTLLSSINRQGLRTACVCISALLNISLNAIMIPSFGYIGAAISTILSGATLYLLFNYCLIKYYMDLQLYKQYLKPLIASIIMGLFILEIRGINLFVLIILSACFYFIMLLLLRVFTKSEKELLIKIIKRGQAPF